MGVVVTLARTLARGACREVGRGSTTSRGEALRALAMVGPLLGLGLALAGCGGGGGGAGDGDVGSSTGGGTTGEAPGPELQSPSELCAEAPAVGPGRFAGNLRDRAADPGLGGVCGGGGPDVFLRVEVPVRADLRVEARGVGFTPRVSLAPVGCQAAPMLACGADGVAGLEDLAEGTVVTLAIGADPQMFADMSKTAAPVEGEDPLDFVVDVAMQRVLAAGEVCLPAARGRCAAGTLCLQEQLAEDTDTDTDGELDERWVCTPLDADSCADPKDVAVTLVDGVGTLVVDPEQPQSDAHRHSCTGDGTRERVLRLRLPAGLGALDSLQIRVEEHEVGLALRAPGCLGSDELACVAPSPAGAQVTIAAPDELQRAGVAPYLFVELPDPGVLAEPVQVHLRRVLRAPPAGG